ncbi:acetylglutamate kinase [Clostridium polyendosporum]|uniref:Acetylglutamate kinase n=1 Tax=Clostridium polyendosporum TaxID=69208 RepID=A0A919RZD7_9CLOT|nr:acetylglutamate kinase [Clostridium polyendosporum]GIM28511.1 acetylglutamate kinase [Clostridium polyendosporum]
MNKIDLEKANTLIQALPYIKEYYGKTVVVKYGGSAMKNQGLKEAVINDLILMSCVGINVVLVHGGGPEINNFLGKLGKKAKFVNGLRYTDEETIEVVQMVLAGKVNKDLVFLINSNGGKAIGLCGIDGNMLLTEKHEGEEDLGFVGEVKKVNTEVVDNCLKEGYIAVIATVGIGEDGRTYNINGDVAAAKIASALKAEKFILLTDVPGLLRDPSSEETLISELKVSEVPELMEEKIISGGMIPKIESCVETVRNGVKKVHIIDGRIPHSILIELFSDRGIGTMIYQ